jgi:hypothetical protein
MLLLTVTSVVLIATIPAKIGSHLKSDRSYLNLCFLSSVIGIGGDLKDINSGNRKLYASCSLVL